MPASPLERLRHIRDEAEYLTRQETMMSLARIAQPLCLGNVSPFKNTRRLANSWD